MPRVALVWVMCVLMLPLGCGGSGEGEAPDGGDRGGSPGGGKGGAAGHAGAGGSVAGRGGTGGDAVATGGVAGGAGRGGSTGTGPLGGAGGFAGAATAGAPGGAGGTAGAGGVIAAGGAGGTGVGGDGGVSSKGGSGGQAGSAGSSAGRGGAVAGSAGSLAGAGGAGGSAIAGAGGAGGTCVVYVTKTGSDANNGRAWATAKLTIDAAITTAAAGGCQVWVAEGTYVPTYKPDPFGPAYSATLQLQDGTEIYGGFAGTEGALAERDLASHATVVSGASTLLVVVTTSGKNKLDGLTVRDGQAGIVCWSAATTADFVNLTVSNNAGPSGAGMQLGSSCTMTVRSSRFQQNSANVNYTDRGGAIYNYGQLTLDDCDLVGNSAQTAGAVYNTGYLTAKNSRFTNNAADAFVTQSSNGGAIYNAGTLTVDGSTFTGNSSQYYGGAVASLGVTTIRHSTFTSNSGALGGAVSHTGPSLVIEDSTFSGQTSGLTGGAVYAPSGATVRRSQFSNNLFGVYASGGTALIEDSAFSGNTNGVRVAGSPATIRRCQFSGNRGERGAGVYAIDLAPTSPLVVASSTFDQNVATAGGYRDGGGAILILNNSQNSVAHATIVDCQFSRNQSAGYGGAIAFTTSTDTVNPDVVIHSSTFFQNSASAYGGGIYNGLGVLSLTNTILWGNSAGQGNQVYNGNGNAKAQVAYSDVQGTGFNTNGNIDADPAFASTVAPIDLSLTAASPCVDTGSTTALISDIADVDGDGNTGEALPLDLAGAARVQGASVDMGAYER